MFLLSSLSVYLSPLLTDIPFTVYSVRLLLIILFLLTLSELSIKSKYDGALPTQENAASGAYKVVRDLYMNTKGVPTGLTAAFIDYIYSPDGAKIIEESGYIPVPKPKN